MEKKKATPSWQTAFINIELLGEGGNAQVFRVQDRQSGEHFALKELTNLSKEKKSRFRSEIKIARENSDTIPGILPIIQYNAAYDGRHGKFESCAKFREYMDFLVKRYNQYYSKLEDVIAEKKVPLREINHFIFRNEVFRYNPFQSKESLDYALYEELYSKDVCLVFLKKHYIDTETYKKALSGSIAMTGTNVDYILKGINDYLLTLAKEQIKLAFAQSEKEVSDLHQRTREGLETARLNGKQIGRKTGSSITTKKSQQAKTLIAKYAQTFGGPLSDKDVIKLADISRNTYYKYKRELEMVGHC